MGSCGRQSQKPLRERIRHFTPAWHAVNMGTGAISALFHTFPYGGNTKSMQIIALFFLLLNLVFFVVLTTCGLARYTLFRGVWRTMIRHPVQSLYLGCFPMGFATIIIAAVGVLYNYFNFGGPTFLYILWALWWVDVAVSVAVCFGQLHIMFTRQNHQIDAMTMVWLLPIVTLIVAAASGAVVAQAMIPLDISRVCLTLAVCMALVTIGLVLAIMVFTIYLHRLIVHGLPQGISIFSAYLPLGPLGQSGYAILLMGEICRQLFPIQGPESSIFTDSMTPHVLYVCAWTMSFALWSLATAWLLLALMALGDTLVKVNLPFKITFWGMIFPNGVYANLTIQLGDTIDSTILRVWGSIYAVFTLCLWTFAIVKTMPSIWDGSIFEAPCLEVAQGMGMEQTQAACENDGLDANEIEATPACESVRRSSTNAAPLVQEKSRQRRTSE